MSQLRQARRFGLIPSIPILCTRTYTYLIYSYRLLTFPQVSRLGPTESPVIVLILGISLFLTYFWPLFSNTAFTNLHVLVHCWGSVKCATERHNWAPSSEFVSSSIPSWQILTAHAQPFRGARDLAFCLKVPLDSLLVWASSEGSGETARMRRLAWTFAARIGDKYQIRLTRSI